MATAAMVRRRRCRFGAFPSFLKEGWREAPGWLAVCSTTPPAIAGTPPHPRRGKNRHVSSFALPSFLKEGWREAPGWSAVLVQEQRERARERRRLLEVGQV